MRRCMTPPTRSSGSWRPASVTSRACRTLPYLAHGSVGIGFALAEYLAHREDAQFSEAATRIRQAASGHFYAQSGLFAGRAGMILYLSHRRSGGQLPDIVADH